jgi:hypothetical protein
MFLSMLATERHVSGVTHNQQAPVVLYREGSTWISFWLTKHQPTGSVDQNESFDFAPKTIAGVLLPWTARLRCCTLRSQRNVRRWKECVNQARMDFDRHVIIVPRVRPARPGPW